jgi:hypothetical protein
LQLNIEEVAGFEPAEKSVPPDAATPTETHAVKVLRHPNDNGGVKGKRPSKKDKLRAAALLAAGNNKGAADD